MEMMNNLYDELILSLCLAQKETLNLEKYKYDPTEMNILGEWLANNGIRFNRHPRYRGEQIVVPDWDWDVVCNEWSYGGSCGLLESMGAIVDEEKVGDAVEGYLTAEGVIKRFKKLMEKVEHEGLENK